MGFVPGINPKGQFLLTRQIANASLRSGMTYLAVQRSGLPWQRVIGLGTQLDTARFRSYLARRLQVPATQVQAMILGEHGDSTVPIW